MIRPFPENPRYLVSTDGIVYGLSGRPLKPQKHSSGYGYKRLQLGRKRQYYVHSIIARTFIGQPNGRDVDHRDGNPSNNRLSNLRYLTHAENMAAMRERIFHCKKGHPFAGNEIWYRGRRTCRICAQSRDKRRYRRKVSA